MYINELFTSKIKYTQFRSQIFLYFYALYKHFKCQERRSPEIEIDKRLFTRFISNKLNMTSNPADKNLFKVKKNNIRT